MTDGLLPPGVTAARPRPRRVTSSVRKILGSNLPICVALLVVLVGVLSASFPLPSFSHSRGVATVPTDPTTGPVLQSTANLTCQASKLLGQSCTTGAVAPIARPSAAGVN